MNYDSRFSYNLTIPVMEIRQITMKSDEMRHMKTSLKINQILNDKRATFGNHVSKLSSSKYEIKFLGFFYQSKM